MTRKRNQSVVPDVANAPGTPGKSGEASAPDNGSGEAAAPGNSSGAALAPENTLADVAQAPARP